MITLRRSEADGRSLHLTAATLREMIVGKNPKDIDRRKERLPIGRQIFSTFPICLDIVIIDIDG